MEMRVLALAFVWVAAFVVLAITCMGAGIVFWVALAVFCLASAYMGKHGKRLEREIDDIFGDD